MCYLKPSLKLEPKLAKLDVTEAAGTVSDLCNLLCPGGLLSKVADRWTDDLNKTESSVMLETSLVRIRSGWTWEVFISGKGVSKAPKGSFSVTSSLEDILKQ